MNKSYIVYIHINKFNGKVYIGITSRPAIKRWGKTGNTYKSNKHFSGAIKKYGWDNFLHIVYRTGLTEMEAKQMEIDLIRSYKAYNPTYGYNKSIGGEGNNKGKDSASKEYSRMEAHKMYKLHKDTIKARNLNYHYTHKEDVKSQHRTYYETHKEDICKKSAIYQKTHRETHNAYQRAYYEAHKEKILARQKNR